MNSHASAEPANDTSNDWRDFGKYRSRIVHKEMLTHDVGLYLVEKPEGFRFQPGQAVELSIDRDGWRDEKRPFTFTGLPDNPRLEFLIKSYPKHQGVTQQLQTEIAVNDRVIFGDPWGAMEYVGPGVFLAGGAGITPLLAILRDLERKQKLQGNRLFFSNKTQQDVFLQGELSRMLGRSAVFTLTREEHHNYEHGRIDRKWLSRRIDDFQQPFYLCGPPQMVRDLKDTLLDLGASEESLVYEQIADDD